MCLLFAPCQFSLGNPSKWLSLIGRILFTHNFHTPAIDNANRQITKLDSEAGEWKQKAQKPIHRTIHRTECKLDAIDFGTNGGGGASPNTIGFDLLDLCVVRLCACFTFHALQLASVFVSRSVSFSVRFSFLFVRFFPRLLHESGWAHKNQDFTEKKNQNCSPDDL